MKNLNCAHGFKDLTELDNGDSKCASCTEGKAKKESHHRQDKKKRDTLELVHSDLSGKITPVSYNGHQYLSCWLMMPVEQSGQTL